MGRTIEGVFWVAAYLAVILAPLVVMMVTPTPPGRSFLAELSVALAFVALAQTAVQFLLIARYRHVTAPYGIDIILKYHREMGMVAVGLRPGQFAWVCLSRTPYSVEEQPEGGTGERGVIDEELLGRHLPREGIERMHFVCGPPPMMDAVENALGARGRRRGCRGAVTPGLSAAVPLMQDKRLTRREWKT